MGVLTALAILAGLIVVHEAGHFFAATWQGIRVSGFSVGFGPVLLQKQRRGVQFALRAIPLGGFVSFPDDDEDSSIPSDDPDLLTNRPLPQRALVIAAGVIANLLLAWAVLMAQGAFVGIPAGFSATPGVLVSGVQQGQAAAASGLKAGDRILAVDGRDLGGGQSAVSQLVELVKGAPDQTLRLQAERQGQALELQLTPADLSGIGRIGAQLQPSGTEAFRRPRSPIEVIQQANHDVALLTKRTVDGFITLVTHFGETAGQVSGPVKIVEMGASLAKQGGSSLFLYTALISINLAVLNALPLPMLDGGQFVLLLLEGLRRKPLPEKFQMAFMQSGFVLLVGLSVVLIVKDTSQLAAVQQLLGR
ncbi:MAG: RIP metalloprotease RseP [Vulcanococcus sp.]|jgi:membrane-associated protease RseP (regulator of RpoE activity)|uniref:RIP metalloprotease RseP n=2 Tax=Synechococcales TaxID=1890424 RepID=UPI001FF89664|nr:MULTISPECIES: RIP metalloprotease RseP [Synechococcaceae]MDA0726915.1 RIP metalloprotease RseP [Cyanobacteriota bacterium]MDA1157079.1 RIP metalloprotease RseP [Cyanobacteriota bacterium]UPH91116.1 RIP metalloprotease RseP [Synechococcus sp. NB0720_010]